MSADKLPLPLRALNHISRVCSDVNATAAFYRDLLDFVDIRRPRFDFEGAWLFSKASGIAIHLIKGTPLPRPSKINPKAEHLSFLCESLSTVEEMLICKQIEYVKQSIIEEDGIKITQLFLHDPDQNMIEICNCDELPMILLESGVQLQTPSPVSSLQAPPALLAMQSSGDHAASFDNLSDEEASSTSSCRSSSDSLYPPQISPMTLSEDGTEPAMRAAAKGLDSRLSFDSHLLLSNMSLH